MLWHKAIGAGGFGGNAPIEYVGSVSKTSDYVSGFDSSAEALDVLSLASPGDLVVIGMTATLGGTPFAEPWFWAGMDFTAIYDEMYDSDPSAYFGYRFVQSGDSNPYIDYPSIPDVRWNSLNVIASVFSGVSSFVASSRRGGSSSGVPNPRLLTANGDLWIATAHTEDDGFIVDTPPTGYTLAAATDENGSGSYATMATAYKIETLSSDDPSAFSSSEGTLNDGWKSFLAAFSD